MPNHVKNVVKMKGITALPLFTVDDDGEKFFDFNKMIPMPESLDIESGSMTDECIIYYLTGRCIKKIWELESEKIDLIRKLVRGDNAWLAQIWERACKKGAEVKEDREMYTKGRIYIDNHFKYGYTTWYDWCRTNWGTKWNAYEYSEIDADTIEFETAWNAPEPVMKKLAEMYPDIEIEHKWADEDMGHNSGCCTYYKGEVSGGYDETDNEAYAHYVECWGESECLYEEDGVWKRKTCEECKACY